MVSQSNGDVGAKLVVLVDNAATTYEDLRSFLSALSPEQKRLAIDRMGGRKRQARLWDLGEAGPAITMESLIPKDGEPLKPVIFHGKNSLLPPFTRFQKRMCRTSDGEALLGYNHGWTGIFTGPGYFVVRDSEPDEIGPVAIDYTRVPTEKPTSWPTIRSNSFMLSRFVYYGMVDCLRELADGVLIGRAVRGGKITPNYFILSREF